MSSYVDTKSKSKHTNNTNWLVSIVMPFYNREKYIAQAIDSVLSQTYTNYEIIAVDDGSTDTSLSLVKSYQSLLKEKLKILQQINGGPAVAKNKAINNAQGHLIAFLDSDDLWPSNKLQVQIDLYNRCENVAFLYSGYSLINEKNEVFKICKPEPRFQGNIYNKLWKYSNEICGGTILVERRKIIKAGLFDADLRGAENLELRIRLSQLGEVYYTEESLYLYRKHQQTLTSNYADMRGYQTKLIKKHFIDTNNKGWLYRVVQAKQFYLDGMKMFGEKKYFPAFRMFLSSIFWNPLATNSYLQAMRCCFGSRINELFSGLKNK